MALVVGLSTVSCALAQTSEKQARTAAPPPDTRDLALVDIVPFAPGPPNMVATETKCDPGGNIFDVQGSAPPALLTSGGLSSTPVSRISITSKSIVPFAVPLIDGYRDVVRFDFDVAPDGKLYVLLQGVSVSSKDPRAAVTYLVARYKGDGSLDSYIALQDTPGGRIQPLRFSTFRNGYFLVAGTTVDPDAGQRPMVGVFDSSGRFLTHVRISEDAAQRVGASHGRKHEMESENIDLPSHEVERHDGERERALTIASNSFLASAADGNIYLLQSTGGHPRLYVVAPGGQVVRQFDVAVPAAGLTPTNMGIAGGTMVFVSFGRVLGAAGPAAQDADAGQLISLLNVYTGEASAVYRLPSDADGFTVPACAGAQDELLFIGATADQQHQAVARFKQK